VSEIVKPDREFHAGDERGECLAERPRAERRAIWLRANERFLVLPHAQRQQHLGLAAPRVPQGFDGACRRADHNRVRAEL
jgi:hypothetical protein